MTTFTNRSVNPASKANPIPALFPQIPATELQSWWNAVRASLAEQLSLLQAARVSTTGTLASSSTPLSFSAENKDAATINEGMAVAPHPSGAGVILAVNTAMATAAIGLSQTTTAPTFSDTFQISGILTLADWSLVVGAATLSPMAVYFLGSTPGTLTTTPPSTPGSIAQIIGYAVAPDSMEILINPPILL